MTTNRIRAATTELKKDQRKTLDDPKSEVRSRLYIKATEDIVIVAVDRIMIPDSLQNQRKSDYVVLERKRTHIIELKGIHIDEAFDQIRETVYFFDGSEETKEWTAGRDILDAYISSPNRQRVPNLPSKKEKELARLLYVRSQSRPSDMFELIHFVKVVEHQRKLAVHGRQILTSHEAPLEFG
ncbi:MAG: hypothetical protein IJC59_07825 [Lachnospiraceae bacterium]|nr:hypothetical protein [Lachnospiraceae bacterium]